MVSGPRPTHARPHRSLPIGRVVHLLGALQLHRIGPTVVITHHLPLCELIAPWRTIDGHEKLAMSNGFACDLWDDIKGFAINAWIWGHSHEGESQMVEGAHDPIRFITTSGAIPAKKPGLILSLCWRPERGEIGR